MHKSLGYLITVVLLLLSGCATASPRCHDMLQAISTPPAFIQYERCEVQAQNQGVPVVAIYRIDGADAAAAEDFLRERFGLASSFVRSCCMWELPAAIPYQENAAAPYYTIRMYSEETVVSTRKDWPKIQNFYLTVTTYSEDI
ncbi:DUF4952 domain-containing protein [Pseudomonas sp. GD03944]|uniref:DUF4952 domain-containing protein n=1 Tax=Pseudomonas sp. GD03944 TaxID=2975409 RepID=UPI0024499EFF|nr:DUF4952 domain-containing protein [Pseudomonas sp. GD03944]MDH1264970.1 DUF4952 domain-containing protein [Pseudomonas sp. GD03944]